VAAAATITNADTNMPFYSQRSSMLSASIAVYRPQAEVFGSRSDKAEALKNWSGAGCDVTSVKVNDAAATMISPTVEILTFKATADGSCFGQKVGPIWGSSIYVKFGDTWKWTFGINVPSRRQGA
jgi:hypothetical protein